jgi:exopolysaccharide production protein ExoQ
MQALLGMGEIDLMILSTDRALGEIRTVLWLTCAWTAAGTTVYLLWPALAPVLLPLCLVMPIAWLWDAHRRLVWFEVSGVSVVVLIAACYALLNSQWSMAKDEAHAYAGMLFVVFLCLHLGLGAWARIGHQPATTAMAVGFYVGFVLAGCLLCFEILSRHAIFFQLMSTFPRLYPQAPKYLSMGALPSYFLNHRMAAVAIMFWPALLTTLRLGATSWRRGLLLAGLLPSLVAVALSEHTTSQVALVMGTLVAVVCHWSWRAAQRLLMLAWIIACLAVVPLSLAAYAANMHHLRWLPPSAQDRLVIWKATSDLIPKAPVLGVGVHSGRVITRAEFERPKAPGTPYALSVGWHSHNAFLQVWFETGAVGAGLLLCFGLLALRGIGVQDAAVQPALLATFATCMMIASAGFSAFAPWLVASYAVCALFAALATAQAATSRSAGALAEHGAGRPFTT